MTKIQLLKRIYRAPEGDDGAAGGGGEDAAAAAEAASAAEAAAASGEQNKETPAGTEDYANIPEKFRVFKDDKSLDEKATSAKLAESYLALEKHSKLTLEADDPRLSPIPETAEAYAINTPEGTEEFLTADDPLVVDAFTKFHGLKMTQAQVDGVLGIYRDVIPQIAAGGAELNGEEVIADLKATVWTKPAEYKENIEASYQAGKQLAENIGMTFEDLEKAGLANNKTFIRLMAGIHKEMKEGGSVHNAAPATGGFAVNSEAEYQALLKNPAYLDGKHADHDMVVASAKAWNEKKNPASKDQ